MLYVRKIWGIAEAAGRGLQTSAASLPMLRAKRSSHKQAEAKGRGLQTSEASLQFKNTMGSRGRRPRTANERSEFANAASEAKQP